MFFFSAIYVVVMIMLIVVKNTIGHSNCNDVEAAVVTLVVMMEKMMV